MRNLAAMMQQAKSVQEDMARMKEELGEMRFTGESGGGSVRVETDGRGQLHQVTLAPGVAGCSNADDIALLEDLIVVAVNNARAEADQARSEKMKEITGGLPLPPGLDLPF